jgi:hypothetical protein
MHLFRHSMRNKARARELQALYQYRAINVCYRIALGQARGTSDGKYVRLHVLLAILLVIACNMTSGEPTPLEKCEHDQPHEASRCISVLN